MVSARAGAAGPPQTAWLRPGLRRARVLSQPAHGLSSAGWPLRGRRSNTCGLGTRCTRNNSARPTTTGLPRIQPAETEIWCPAVGWMNRVAEGAAGLDVQVDLFSDFAQDGCPAVPTSSRWAWLPAGYVHSRASRHRAASRPSTVRHPGAARSARRMAAGFLTRDSPIRLRRPPLARRELQAADGTTHELVAITLLEVVRT